MSKKERKANQSLLIATAGSSSFQGIASCIGRAVLRSQTTGKGNTHRHGQPLLEIKERFPSLPDMLLLLKPSFHLVHFNPLEIARSRCIQWWRQNIDLRNLQRMEADKCCCPGRSVFMVPFIHHTWNSQGYLTSKTYHYQCASTSPGTLPSSNHTACKANSIS